jgi:signal transduction histidine kinase
VAAAARAALRASLRPLVLPTLAIVYGAASVSLALNSEFLTTYGATSWIAAATGLVAGLALIVAGTFVSVERPTGSLGPVTTLLGVVWLAQDWAGWVGPAFAHSVAMIVAPFMTALLLHLVLAAPGGRIVGRTPRLVVAIVYGTTALYSVGRALFRDPFLDLSCWYNCTGNVFLLRSEPELVRFLDGIWLSFSLIACVVIVVLACWRLLSATRPGRAALQPLLVPAGLAAVSYGAYAVALVVHRAEDPEKAVFHALFLARGFSLAFLAAGVSWTVMRTRRTHLAIARLAVDLGEAPEPGSLRAALARSLGDEQLEVAYRLPDSPLLVDAEARPVSLPDGGSRTATPIVRNGETVALVIHDRSLSSVRELDREIGAAARLAVDNERLRAEVLAQLEDLRASRARIVEAGDEARRRLERDLHDGAQQRLLTLLYELRLARAAASAGGDDDSAAVLASTGDQVQEALRELRDLAHGIYPVILTEAGLGPALLSLADEAPLPVEVIELPRGRVPVAVERAAYLVVADGIDAAVREGADHVQVIARRQGDALEVRLTGVESAPSVQLADRVGALGGRIAIEDRTLRAEIPCA